MTSGIAQQAQLAASQGKIVVVVVDTWTMRLANYSQLLTPLDQYSSVNCITMIVWNEGDNETPQFKNVLEMAVKGAFQTKSVQKPSNFLSTSIKSYDTFKSELVRALGQAQAQIIETAKIQRDLPAVLFQNGADEFASKPSL